MKIFWLIIFSFVVIANTLHEDVSDVCALRLEAWKQILSEHRQQCILKTIENNKELKKVLVGEVQILKSEATAALAGVNDKQLELKKAVEEVRNGLSFEFTGFVKKVESALASGRVDQALQGFKISIVDAITAFLSGAMQEINKNVTSDIAKFKEKLATLENNGALDCVKWKSVLGDKELVKLETGTYFQSYSRNLRMHWNDAQMFCNNLGLELVIISTENVLKSLIEAESPNDFGYWIGASDIGHDYGQFFWTNGSLVNDSWRLLTRSDSRIGSRNCLNLYSPNPFTKGKVLWADKCNSTRTFVCQVTAKYLKCL